MMTAVHHIRGGFRDAGGTVNVTADVRCALLMHQLPAVVGFADGFITGGRIKDDVRSVQAEP